MLKPYVNSAEQEVTVFDTTPFGCVVMAERTDEPGDERPKPGDGVPGEATAGRHRLVRLLAGDTEGDWSWKPGRDRLLGDKMVTFRGVPPGMPEQLAAERSKPRVQYGLGIEQTREQFWESSEVERRETKRAFLAHLPR